MPEVVVRAERLRKRYRIGAVQQKYPTLRDRLAEIARSPGRMVSRGSDCDYFHAIDDVSFEVRSGEVVGIIGRNGAGKSTLLKLLARITEPTSGQAEIRGRVASLLEVGTGFHPELSGRENIFLNGAILGMPQAETRRKFDEIVEFGEVARFIDTPVKHYSSGMYLRLAFAVAAHLEPDILLVDEVLAVGDTSFQRKCLNKMQNVSDQGRTVLFVSHNMPAVTRLCPRTILLDNGIVVADGPSAEVASRYLHSGLGTTAARQWENAAEAPGNEVCRLRAIKVTTPEGAVCDAVQIARPVNIEVHWDVRQPGHVLVPILKFYTDEGVCAFITQDLDPEWRRRQRPEGRYVSTLHLPGNFFSEGTMIVAVCVNTMDPVTIHAEEREAVAFQVVDDLSGDTARGDYSRRMVGVLRPLLPWSNSYRPGSEAAFEPVDELFLARAGITR